MTLKETLASVYAWADAHALEILVIAIAVPVVGAVLARVGKAGRTDKDGRVVASAVVGFGLIAFLLEMVLALSARSLLEKDVTDANVMLLLAPVLCLTLSLVLIRLVFPLGELASVKQAADIAAFVAVCWGIHWLFGRFHWGVVFFGGLLQLGLMLGLGLWLVVRLYRRAFRASTAEA